MRAHGVPLRNLIVLVAVLLVLAGCGETEVVTIPPTSADDGIVAPSPVDTCAWIAIDNGAFPGDAYACVFKTSLDYWAVRCYALGSFTLGTSVAISCFR